MKLIWVLIPLLLSIVLTLGTETVLAQPAITGVEVFNVAESSVTVTWSTEELGDSVVRYGTHKDFGFTVSDSSLTTDHVVSLADLSPGTRYYFAVQSTDAEGNASKDVNGGKSYTFKTLKARVLKKTFVGIVVENATSTSSLINATSTVTIIRQGKGERITIALPNTYTLKTPGGPRAGTFGEGAQVVIRAVRTRDQWVAASVLVKPVSPNVPVTGVVIGVDETNMTVMTRDGITHTFELADNTARPSKGEVLTVFQSLSSRANGKAKGLVKREEVFRRLQAFLESAFDSETNVETDYLSQLLEEHGAQSIRIINEVLLQAPDNARVDISNSREKIQDAAQAAKVANNNQKPATPPGLSNKDSREDSEKHQSQGLGEQSGSNDDDEQRGNGNQNPGQGPGEQSGSNDDDEREGDSRGKGNGNQNPGQGPPNPDNAEKRKGNEKQKSDDGPPDPDEVEVDEKQNPGRGSGAGGRSGSRDDDKQRAKWKGGGK